MNAPRLLTLVETPPASPEAVARMMDAAREAARALSLDLAYRARALALDCQAVAAMGDAAQVGVRERSSRMVGDLVGFAATVEKLAG